MPAEDTIQATFFLIRLSIYFILGCAGPLLLHKSFLWLWPVGALCCSVLASHCSGLSQSPASTNPPGSGIQQVSPALQGRFLTTRPLGKSQATIQSHHCYPCFYFLNQSFIFFKIYLVSSFWLCWLFIAVRGLSVVVESGSLLWLQLSVIAESGFLPWLWFFSFSLQWILLLQGMGPQSTMASVFAAHGLGSCGPWAQLSLSMWVLPGPGIVLMSPALAGGFFTTEPLGKPKSVILKQTFFLNDFQFLKNYSNSVKKENYLWTKICICQKQKIA